MRWTITVDGYNFYDDQSFGEVFGYNLIDALEFWISRTYCPSDRPYFMSEQYNAKS
jgi:hypothetical protein